MTYTACGLEVGSKVGGRRRTIKGTEDRIFVGDGRREEGRVG